MYRDFGFFRFLFFFWRRLPTSAGRRSRLRQFPPYSNHKNTFDFKWVPIEQGAEYEIVIVSLVKNREGTSAGFIGEYERANVTNPRAREAVYFVGSWDFWTRERKQDRKDTNTNSKGVINRHYMSDIVNKHESLHQQNEGRSFVTRAVNRA